jgi:hypothetical protein
MTFTIQDTDTAGAAAANSTTSVTSVMVTDVPAKTAIPPPNFLSSVAEADILWPNHQWQYGVVESDRLRRLYLR